MEDTLNLKKFLTARWADCHAAAVSVIGLNPIYGWDYLHVVKIF